MQELNTIIPSTSSASWSTPRPSADRESSIECALYGIALGEAVGARFEGCDSQIELQNKGSLRIPVAHGLATHISISVGQALLESRSSATQFAQSFGKRALAHKFTRFPWTLFGRLIPNRHSSSRAFRGRRLEALDLLLPAIPFASVSLQGTTNRISPWMKGLFESCGFESSRELDFPAFGKLLARVTQLAMFYKNAAMTRDDTMRWLVEGTREKAVLEWLECFCGFLDQGKPVSELKQCMESQLAQAILPGDPRLEIFNITAVWLEHPTDWQKGITQCLSLGGRTSVRCATYSALASIATSGACLPREAVTKHRWLPISIGWIDTFIDRLLQWPHGKDDLVAAHGLRSPAVGMFLMHQVNGIRELRRKVLNSSLSLFRRKSL